MLKAQTWERARPGRMERYLPIFKGFRTNFIESPPDARPAPQAFLVEQNAGISLQAHFHSEHQFQVVAMGSGMLGTHPLKPFDVHYTSCDAPYGPIVAGPDGLAYFTLRAISNEGAFFMPESRAQIRRELKRNQVTADAPAISDSAALRDRSEPVVETLIAPQADGLAAWLVRVPAGARVQAPQHPNGAGRFYVVAAGVVRWKGASYPELSTLWTSPQDEPFLLEAGEEGLEVLALQYPDEALKVAA